MHLCRIGLNKILSFSLNLSGVSVHSSGGAPIQHFNYARNTALFFGSVRCGKIHSFCYKSLQKFLRPGVVTGDSTSDSIVLAEFRIGVYRAVNDTESLNVQSKPEFMSLKRDIARADS